MSRFDWDRVAREERVRTHGSEPAWLDVGVPRWKRQKPKRRRDRTASQGVKAKSSRRRRKKRPRSAIVDVGGFDELIRCAVTESGGWVTIVQLVNTVNEQRESAPVTDSQVRASVKARRAKYVLDGDRVRLRTRPRR